MAEWSGASSTDCNAQRLAEESDSGHVAWEPKHMILLSHSGDDKLFVESLCDELHRCLRYPFFDLLEDSLPIDESFPPHIFEAIRQCYVGVVVLSESFVTSKWPMMELEAMQKEAERRSDFKLIPVFLRTSVAELGDAEKLDQWRKCWDGLASKNPGRVDVAKWEAALQYVRQKNGLVKSGECDTEFVKKIVDRVCGIVPAEMKVEDSHIQGRARLCKVIRDRIELLEKGSGGVCKVGLYGVGGIGKTTICKALCNELFTEFRGRVCHAELEKLSEEELLRDVLKRLSDTKKEEIDRCNVGQLRNGLKEGKFIRGAVFLAVDNMSDAGPSVVEAKRYVSAGLPPGSIVIVTTRYRASLARVGLDVDGDECMEMPELESDEARCLFLTSCEGRNGDDERLIQRCIKRCRSSKGDGEGSYHYNPLALDVLGRVLAQKQDWEAQLHEIDNSSEHHDPIFSVLRRSFDALLDSDKLLFMDVALFLPGHNSSAEVNVLEWLGVVFEIRMEDVRNRLERLKKKSLLESYGDGKDSRSFRMHDLWRDFCMAETKCREPEGRRWVYEKGSYSESSPCKTHPGGSCWEKVKRMAFLEFMSWSGVTFAHFPNVSVFIIRGSKFTEELVLDLSGLLHLRSLEISESSVVVRGFPRDLGFLILDCCFHPGNDGAVAAEIQGLKQLQCLHLIHYDGDKLPDVRNTTSLHKAKFLVCRNVVAVNGLSSNLRVLHFESCCELRSCVGVGALVFLEELVCKGCLKLEVLPNLGRLRRLRILDISGCELITEVPGLGDLVALEELRAAGCRKLSKLSAMRKVVHLRVLGLKYCESITEIPCLDSSTSLEEIEVDFRAMAGNPNLGQLTRLRKVWIDGLSSAGVQGLSNLTTLHTLHIGHCRGMDELPDLQRLIQLQHMTIENSDFKDVSGLSLSIPLETLEIYECTKLERLPSWQRLASLKGLKVVNCPGQTRSDPMVVEQVELKWNLERLELGNCGFNDLRTLGSFPELERLEIESLRVTELPDLSDVFPRLRHLELKNCAILERLSNRAPVKSLCKLVLVGCASLAALPDLCEKYPGLSCLALSGSNGITSLSSSGPTRALTLLVLDSCNALTSVPDLAMFPALEELDLSGCRELKALSCSVPLASLTTLKVTSCQALKAVSDLAMFPALKELDLHGCSELEALSISVRDLTALRKADVRGCTHLMRDDVKLLRSLVDPECVVVAQEEEDQVRTSVSIGVDPECVVVAQEEEDQVGTSVSIGVDQGDDMGRIWRYRLVGWCGVLASVGIVVYIWKRRGVTW